MAKSRRTKKPQRDIYQEITDRIVEHLDAGSLPPWRQPLKRSGGDPFPRNLVTGKPYRGINLWWLAMLGMEHESNHWLTFKQAKSLGGQVRKGEKGSLVTFWKVWEKEDKESGETTALPVLRHYTVFNADQVDGVKAPDALEVDPATFNPIAEAEKILAGFAGRPRIERAGLKTAYRPKSDLVLLPPPERFDTPEDYYATLFHELVHATGHSSRLDRGLDEDLAPFGSPDYSKEELVAEMGSAFLNAVAGISPPTIEQSASYIQGWLKELREDRKLLVQAAGLAQKAADHILGITFGEAARPPPEITAQADTPNSNLSLPQPTQRELF